MSRIKHLEHLCVVHADFDIWSGQTRLTAKDLKWGIGGEAPPETVAQLGSKRICDPSKTKGFSRIKTKCRRFLLSHGMPFMNGVAIPASKMDMVHRGLADIAQEFNQEKLEFLNGYDQAISEWIDANKEYGEAIRNGAMPRDKVADRISFDYQIFMIQPVTEDGDGAVTVKRLKQKVDGLGQNLLDEVVEEANRFFDNNLRGRVECGVNTQLTLRKIRDKVDGLSFLNGNLMPLVNLLDETLKGYRDNADGRFIRAPFFYQVLAAVVIMGDRKRIEEYASGAVTLDGMTDSVTPDEVKESNAAMVGGETQGTTAQSDTAAGGETQGIAAQETEQSSPEMSEDDIDADLDKFFGALDAEEQGDAEQVEQTEQSEPAEQAGAVAEEDFNQDTGTSAFDAMEQAGAGEESYPDMPEIDEEEDFFF